MSLNDDDLTVTLPDELRRQFAEVQRRLWRVETTVALSSAVGGLLVTLLILFLSDRIWNTPAALRLVFALAGIATTVVALWRWARRWLWRRRTLRDLANIVQKKHRRLGDRLLGIVELAEEQRHQANFSPALYHAAIHQVADEARQYDFRQSVSARPAEKYGMMAAVAALCILALALALPQATWNAFVRWLAPTSPIPRYTLVALDGLPRELIVPHGEPFTITGKVHYRSFWKPSHVSGRIWDNPELSGAVDRGTLRIQVPGQVEDRYLHLQIGDAVAEVKITPVYRPSLRELTARIHLPDYLQYPDQTQAVQSGSLLAVEGSRVAFHGNVSRALTSAVMQPGEGKTLPLDVQGETFSTPPSQPEGMAEYIFNWRDNLGLTNAAPLRLSVVMQKDAPPAPELPDLPGETALLASDVLRIRVEATDDYGIRDFGLTWDLSSESPLTEGYVAEIKNMPPSHHVKKAVREFVWSPQEFRLPPDSTVEIQGFARDFYPDRERSRTALHRIRILSPEQHAELLREQLESVMARVEDVTRLQEKITANLHDLKDSTNLPEMQKSARLGQSKDDQKQNSSSLNELSRQAGQTVQEAMKNPLFPAETIQQWSETARQWQQLARDKMQAAAKAMQQAQKDSPSRQQEMADATKKADDILNALEKMQEKNSQHLDQLQALTLSERLHKVGTQEGEIRTRLLQAAPEIIGLPPGDLPDKFKRFDESMSTDQGKARKESDKLQGEISRFFERTRLTNYGSVSKEMKETHAADELDRVGGLIGDNIAIEASGDLGKWSVHFKKWGDALEPKPDEGGAGGQGANGAPSNKEDLTKQFIALLRLRENEENLRDQTSVLDQQKGTPSSYKENADSLAQTQKNLGEELDRIRAKMPLPALQPAFAQTTVAMRKVESILPKPETGKPADESEGKAIDDLTDLVNLINEQAQHAKSQPSAGSSSSAQEMAFLLRMMQQNSKNAKATALQPATGLNNAGGKTDRAGNPISGNAAGKGAGSRNVEKASGAIENSPSQFRDAMDIYFHGIEQNKN